MYAVEHCSRAKLNQNYNYEKEKSSKESDKENKKKTSIVFLKIPSARRDFLIRTSETYQVNFLMKLNPVCLHYLLFCNRNQRDRKSVV